MNTCYKNLSEIMSLKEAHEKDGRNLSPEDTSIIEDAAVIFDQEKILWIGETQNIPSEIKIDKMIDLAGHVLTPEIVDSHTHLVFAGDRSQEYTMRLNGADYQEIANSGGGILSTMKTTREADPTKLFFDAVKRVERIHSYGVGTIEIKSGYGLSLESERKLTSVIQKLKEHFREKVQILNTYMAAHAIPKSFDSADHYLDQVVFPLMEEFSRAGTVDFVDIFHEKNYFEKQVAEKFFNRAKKLNLKIKTHADELNNNGGAELAAKYNAVSADHLLQVSQAGIKSLANSSTVATLLPGTAYFLGKPLAPARALLNAGCKVALASDYNPGSCHCDNLLLISAISAMGLQMNQAELWSAITLNASSALGLERQGAIIKGLKPRFSVFKCDSIDQITYSWGRNFSVPNPA